jgi:hypothetical protein
MGQGSRFKKLLERLGKATIMAAESETSEIIRRLFEWDPHAVGTDGKVVLSKDATETCKAYADWIAEYRQQVPTNNAVSLRAEMAETPPLSTNSRQPTAMIPGSSQWAWAGTTALRRHAWLAPLLSMTAP